MDFQTFAREELIALASKLTDAAEARTEAAVVALTAELNAETAAEISRVRAAAGVEAGRERDEAEAEISRLRAELAQEGARARVEAEAATIRIRDEAAREADVARAAADAALTTLIAASNAELATANAEIARLEASSDSEVQRLRTALDEAVARTGALSAEAAGVRATAEAEVAATRAAARSEIAATRAAAESEIAAIRAAADDAARTSGTFGAMVEKLRTTQAELAAENERLAAEHAALTWERADLLESAEVSHRGTLIARLASVFDGVASATTVEDVLTRAAAGLDREFARVAVFIVRDNRLTVIDRHGFDANSGIEKVVVPLGVDSFLSEAALARDLRMLHGDTLPPSAPFGGSPTLIMTAPIAVRGETLAVVYADDSGRSLDARAAGDSCRLAGLLRAHAALKLERLTIELTVINELRAYAQMLVDEVEYVYDADTASAKPGRDRLDRLQENLRCARQIYGQRVTLEGPAAAALLDEVVHCAVERKAGSAFARDLAALLPGGIPVAQRA